MVKILVTICEIRSIFSNENPCLPQQFLVHFPAMSFQVRRIGHDGHKRRFLSRLAVIGLKVARPLTQVLAGWRRREEERERAKRWHWGITVLVAGVCAFIVWMGVTSAWGALRALSVRSVLTIAAADLPMDDRGHTNILLLGQGDAAGEDLTDTIMIASLDAANHNAVLLSLPRDLYFLHFNNLEPGKLNTVYRDLKARYKRKMDDKEASLEALKGLASEIGSALDIDLHGIVKVDFEGFVKAVDAIGGVQVDVPRDIVDTAYPTENYGYQTFSINAGPQLLDGETALKYVRTRHTTSDFDRSARQQQVLSAIVDTVRDEGLLKKARTILALQDIVSEHVEMTLDIGQILGLAKAGAEINRSDIISMQLSDRNALYGEVIEAGGFLYTPPRDLFDGASVLLPVSIPEFPVTWKQILTLKRLLLDIRTPYLQHPTFAILNAGARSGVARKLGTEFTRYGFTVDRIANASIGDQEEAFVAPGESATKEQAEFFASMLGLPLKDAPIELRPEERANVIIVLGENYDYTPFQSLHIPE